MKQIRLRKLVILLVITLGLYGLVWVARRRGELVRNLGQNIPHWIWLVIPTVGLSALASVAMFAATTYTDQPDEGWMYQYGIYVLVVLAAGLVYLVLARWVYLFARAFDRATNGTVNYFWVLLGWLTFGLPVVVVALQYYVNRLPADPRKYRAKQPIVGDNLLKKLAVVLFVVHGLAAVGAAAGAIASETARFTGGSTPFQLNAREEIQSSPELRELNELRERYSACITQLNVDFPGEITDENGDAYDAAYDKCDDLYEQARQKADALNAVQPGAQN